MLLLSLFALFSVISGCSEDALNRCRKRMAADCLTKANDVTVCVADCASDEAPKWAKDECCVSCVPRTRFSTCTSTPLLGSTPTSTSGTSLLDTVYDWSKTCKIVECTSEEVPVKVGMCCQTCVRPASRCTFEQMKTCATKEIADCGDGEYPKRGLDCCETCRVPAPPVCSLDKEGWLALRVCDDREEPQKGDDGCPTCIRPLQPQPVCTDVTCGVLATCAEGILPERNPDNECCKTCKPLLSDCTQAKVEACRGKYDSLPECASLDVALSRDNFDSATCCPKCKRPAPVDVTERPDTDGGCTYEAFKKCLLTKPVCASPEEYFVDKLSCCGTCQRPERQTTLEQAAKCLAQRPVCDATTRPVAVADEPCSSCRKPVPCSRANPCGDNSVCYRDECVAKKAIRISLKVGASVAEVTAKLAELKDEREALAEVLKESLKRFCENQDVDRQEICRRLARTIATLVIKGSVDWSDVQAKLDFTIEFAQAAQAEASTGGGRRLLQDSTEGDVVVDAMSDQDSGFAGVTASWTYGELDAANAALPSFVALASLLALALWA